MASNLVYGNRNENKNKSNTSHTDRKGTGTKINYRGNGDKVTNVCVELHPIGYYINDRKEMINQMFSVMKPDKLRAMLPPILKGTSIEELKIYCLNELLGMSWKYISYILGGWELQRSESEIESISSPVKNKNKRCHVKWRMIRENYLEEANNDVVDRTDSESSIGILEIGVRGKEIDLLNSVSFIKRSEHKRQSEDLDPSESCNKKCKRKSKKTIGAASVKQVVKRSGKYEFIKTIDTSNKKPDSKRIESQAEDNTESKEKTNLEILELEMRARAIRAMLKQYEEKNQKEGNGSSAD